MTAGSELVLWWYFWYVLAGLEENNHRPTTEPEMPAGGLKPAGKPSRILPLSLNIQPNASN